MKKPIILELQDIKEGGGRIPTDLIEKAIAEDKAVRADVDGDYTNYTIFLPNGDTIEFRRLTN